jgi:glycosyltransferase involved in cell wall biosynthesis
MAMGVPVVGTRQGVLGLAATDDDGVRIVDEPAGFAGAVVALLADPERRRACGLRARAWVERHHRWEDHGARLAALLRTIAGAR